MKCPNTRSCESEHDDSDHVKLTALFRPLRLVAAFSRPAFLATAGYPACLEFHNTVSSQSVERRPITTQHFRFRSPTSLALPPLSGEWKHVRSSSVGTLGEPQSREPSPSSILGFLVHSKPSTLSGILLPLRCAFGRVVGIVPKIGCNRRSP